MHTCVCDCMSLGIGIIIVTMFWVGAYEVKKTVHIKVCVSVWCLFCLNYVCFTFNSFLFM